MSKKTKECDLSVVVPIFNGSQWLNVFLESLSDCLLSAGLEDAPVYIVNDGSTDSTLEILKTCTYLNIQIINQENAGRLPARIRGLSEVQTTFCLLIDVKVTLKKSSLSFALDNLRRKPMSCWTAHVDYALINWSSVVWVVLEKFAWRAYWKDPRRIHFFKEHFDDYPKGTTALIGNSKILLTAMNDYTPKVNNLAHANDDTAILRSIAMNYGIHLSPEYSCTYHPRTSFLQFIKHVFNRGIFFVDGHLNTSSGIMHKILKLAVGAVLATGVSIFFPLFLWLAFAGLLGFLFFTNQVTDLPPTKRLLFLVMMFPFSVLYLSGVTTGIFHRLTTKFG